MRRVAWPMFVPELIIFDCDGVLIDSESLAFEALCSALVPLGITLTATEARQRYTGLSEASEIKDIEERYSVKLTDDYFAMKEQSRLNLFERFLKPVAGIFDLLAEIKVKKCVASSSSPARLKHSLGLSSLWDEFAPYIFSSTQVENGKPAPDLFLFAAAQMGFDPEDCLVIEDSLAGVRAAKAASMRVLGFTGGGHCDRDHTQRLSYEGIEVFARMDQIQERLRRGFLPFGEAHHVR